MGSEQLGYTPPEASGENKQGEAANNDLTRRLVDAGLEKKGMGRISKEEVDELIAKLHRQEKPERDKQ